MLKRWALWNGSLAALGSLLALAHPFAIIVSFIGAPIATLNPFIGVGLFSGIVQALLYRPRISDAEGLTESLTSIKGVYKNRITHVLLVFLLSSVGGAIGNFISIPSLAGVLLGGGGH
jgi:pheromone shutdown protein TraB